jgi:hypothetical protein
MVAPFIPTRRFRGVLEKRGLFSQRIQICIQGSSPLFILLVRMAELADAIGFEKSSKSLKCRTWSVNNAAQLFRQMPKVKHEKPLVQVRTLLRTHALGRHRKTQIENGKVFR